MGKTHTPLKILVIGQIHPELAALAEQGHQVDARLPEEVGFDLGSYDLILGPNCARYLPGMEKFLPAFLKGARLEKFPKGKK